MVGLCGCPLSCHRITTNLRRPSGFKLRNSSLILLDIWDDLGCYWILNWWRWRELNPRPRSVKWRFIHRLGPFFVTSAGGTDNPDRGLIPLFRSPSGDVAAIYPVPPFGRPKSPVGWFYEPATRRSRGLAHPPVRRRGPVRSYRWLFCFDRLVKGAHRSTPACTTHPDVNLSKPVTPEAPGSFPQEGTVGSSSIRPQAMRFKGPPSNMEDWRLL